MINAFLIGMKKCLLFFIYSSIIFWIQHLLSFQFHTTQKFDFKQVVDNHSQYADRKKKSKKILGSVKAAEIAIRKKYIVDCVLTNGVSKIDRIKIF